MMVRLTIISAVAGMLLGLPTTAQAAALGETTYTTYCAACHAPSNIMVSSPKAGGTAAWQKRSAERGGLAALVASALKGREAMPAKGTCGPCTAQDVEAAILLMSRTGPSR